MHSIAAWISETKDDEVGIQVESSGKSKQVRTDTRRMNTIKQNEEITRINTGGEI
jgi:hypothetical protein